MARGEVDLSHVISDSEPDEMISPAIRTRRPISPPLLTRQSSGTVQTELSSLETSTSLRGSQGSTLKPTTQDAKGSYHPVHWPSSIAKGAPGEISQVPPADQRDIKMRTPKKNAMMSLVQLESTLRDFSCEIGVNHAKLTTKLLYDSWKRDAPEPQFASEGKDWFAGVKLDPVSATNKTTEAMRIKTKVRIFPLFKI